MPALAQCPCFESGSSEFCEPGTDRHSALASCLKGDESECDLLTEEESDAVKWAGEYVKLKANTESFPIVSEHPLSLIDEQWNEVFRGTVDVACGADIFDLKWRVRDYTAQMAAYVLLRIQETGLSTIRVHILYGECRRIETLSLDEESAWAILRPIIDRYNAPDKKPTPCDYCGWCANRLNCSALRERAGAVATGREDWELQNYHASEITDEVEMGKALKLARLLKTKWIPAVEFHALDMVHRQGKQIPGFTLTERNGKKFCSDVAAAFSALAGVMSQAEFLSACDLRMQTSKKYPDRKGVVQIFAANQSLKAVAAKRQVESKLEGILATGNKSFTLKSTNSTEDETEE